MAQRSEVTCHCLCNGNIVVSPCKVFVLQAASPEDSAESLMFMQEMIELSKAQTRRWHLLNAVYNVLSALRGCHAVNFDFSNLQSSVHTVLVNLLHSVSQNKNYYYCAALNN